MEIQCDFSQGDHSTTMAHWGREDLRPRTGKVQTCHEYCNLYVIMM